MRPRRVTLPRFSDRLSLGGSGLQVSPFCVGMTTPEVVLEAFDAGINFFFVTGDLHWPHYEGLRRGLSSLFERGGSIRDEVVVAVVSYLARPEQLVGPFVEVIESIRGLERIDVCVGGWVMSGDDPRRGAKLREHRDTGRFGCRAVGASFHHRQLVAPSVQAGEVDIAFIRYNAQHPGAREDIFPHLGERTALVYGFKSIMSWVTPAEVERIEGLPEGTWVPEPTDSFRFSLSSPEMDGLLCAPQTPREVRELADALEKGPLDSEEEEHMIDLVALATGAGRLVDAPGSAGVV